MNEVVMDASAILAIFQGERGSEILTAEIMSSAIVSTVNLAEVQSKLVKNGYTPDEAWENALTLVPEMALFTAEQAKIAGSLIATTQKFGLSLGDRSCLALALSLGAEVYTTEKVWKNLNLGIPIHVIR